MIFYPILKFSIKMKKIIDYKKFFFFYNLFFLIKKIIVLKFYFERKKEIIFIFTLSRLKYC
jgi:hypothetical protein